MTSKKIEREYLTAISIIGGIITLIEPNGNIGYYRQRGIQTMEPMRITRLIRAGSLDPNWRSVKELPRNWSIEFEDEEIMGKARATYPYIKDKK